MFREAFYAPVNDYVLKMKIIVKYHLSDDRYDIESEIKPERVKEVIEEFLRTQIGLGEDKSEPSDLQIYTITLDLNLDGDIFTINSNTKNKSLTTGILFKLTLLIAECSERVVINGNQIK